MENVLNIDRLGGDSISYENFIFFVLTYSVKHGPGAVARAVLIFKIFRKSKHSIAQCNSIQSIQFASAWVAKIFRQKFCCDQSGQMIWAALKTQNFGTVVPGLPSFQNESEKRRRKNNEIKGEDLIRPTNVSID